MWSVDYFEVALWVGRTPSSRDWCTASIDEVTGLLDTQGAICLDVDAIERRDTGAQVSLGNLMIWLNGGGMAWVRLLEHSEHVPCDRKRQAMTEDVGGFLSDGKESFSMPASMTITAEQARHILCCWVSFGTKAPELDWPEVWSDELFERPG